MAAPNAHILGCRRPQFARRVPVHPGFSAKEAWRFEDPEWLLAGIKLQSNAKYNMRIRMKSHDGNGNKTHFLNKSGNKLTTSTNNYYISRISGTRREFSRIWNVIKAE
jgi:hypothetical protein